MFTDGHRDGKAQYNAVQASLDDRTERERHEPYSDEPADDGSGNDSFHRFRQPGYVVRERRSTSTSRLNKIGFMLRFGCMQVSESKIKELTKALKHIRGIQTAYLFGSQAKQIAGSRSDVDVAVLIDRHLSPTVRREVETAVFQVISQTLHRNDIDLIELNQAPVILRYAATVHGRPLFVKAGRDTHRLRFRSIREFEDFRPYLERRRRTLKEHLLSV